MFLTSVFFLCLLFVPNYSMFSKIKLEPQRVLLNATSQAKFICSKEEDDNQSLEINISPNISLKYIQLFINHLNNTTTGILLHSYDYIGAFYLNCLSKGENDYQSNSFIKIGKPPGLFFRAEPCRVYYDKYIDCQIRAPNMVRAIVNRLDYNFTFRERRLSSQSDVYRKTPKLIKTDSMNNTLTFRWFPQETGYFPLNHKMIIYATIIDFGTTNHTMDMTPIFQISSNFTVHVVSPRDLQIDFPHREIPSVCHGNLTQDDQKKNRITFDEFNFTTIYITDLYPNTWYELCFHCRRYEPFHTISNIECQRHQTLKIIHFSMHKQTIVIIFSLLLISILILLTIKCYWNRIKQILASCKIRSYKIIQLDSNQAP